jgi:hypothetical protein
MTNNSGFGTGSRVCPIDQATLLKAIVCKLAAEIPSFSTQTTCLISDEPWPSVEVNDYVFCTVCPLSDSFTPDDTVGGSDQGVIEVSSFRVTVWSRMERDQLEREGIAFLDAEQGLLPLKKAVLKCLAGKQIYMDYPDNTIPLLIEFCRPVSAHHPPSKQHHDDYSSFGITFEAPFYWDLTE